jgi:hypothetical protein
MQFYISFFLFQLKVYTLLYIQGANLLNLVPLNKGFFYCFVKTSNVWIWMPAKQMLQFSLCPMNRLLPWIDSTRKLSLRFSTTFVLVFALIVLYRRVICFQTYDINIYVLTSVKIYMFKMVFFKVNSYLIIIKWK